MLCFIDLYCHGPFYDLVLDEMLDRAFVEIA